MRLEILNRESLKQGSHVDRQQIGAMPAPDCHDVEHAVSGNANREDGVAEVAVDVANVLRNDLGRHFRVAKGLSAYAKEEEEEEEEEEESSVNL